jgi:hypothetical protein
VPKIRVGRLRNRTVDLLLTMSIPGRNSTAATLVRAGFVVVLVPVNVSGLRPVLARGWHGQTSSVSGNVVGCFCFRTLLLSCGVSSADVHGRMSPSSAVLA